MNHRAGVAALAVAVVLAIVIVDRFHRAEEPQRATFVIFGGLSEVELRGVSAEQAAPAFAAIGQTLQRDQRAWHPWEMSDLMRLNAAIAQGQNYQVPAELAGLIRSAQNAFVTSDGLFNPAVGALIDLWGFHTSDYPITTPPPPQRTIDELLATRPRMDDLSVAEDGTVSSRNPRVELDLNGLAEGYACEQIATLLRTLHIDNALVNIGGDVLALGQAGTRPWRVAISSPQHEALASAELHGHEALFSSGNYNKYRESQGKRWGHILDPRSGNPAHGVSAVSVIHPDAIVADVASTTLMIGGIEEMPRLARSMGVSCVVLVSDDGTVWITPAMQRRLTFTVAPAALRISEDLGPDCASLVPAGKPLAPVQLPHPQ